MKLKCVPKLIQNIPCKIIRVENFNLKFPKTIYFQIKTLKIQFKNKFKIILIPVNTFFIFCKQCIIYTKFKSISNTEKKKKTLYRLNSRYFFERYFIVREIYVLYKIKSVVK